MKKDIHAGPVCTKTDELEQQIAKDLKDWMVLMMTSGYIQNPRMKLRVYSESENLRVHSESQSTSHFLRVYSEYTSFELDMSFSG